MMRYHTVKIVEKTVHHIKQARMIQRFFKRTILLTIGIATLAILLAACGAGGAISHSGDQSTGGEAGRILIQLFDAPGFMYPSVNGVPEWTLYGDGTLIFQRTTIPASSSGQSILLSAHLTSAQVAHILDVVVNHHHFFASDQSFYGLRIPDAGLTLLYVASNGQQKMVKVGGAPSTPDTQMQNIFAIVQYVRTYTPVGAQPYTPAGVGVLAIAQGQATPGEKAWPASGVALATVASRECPLLGASGGCIAQAKSAGVSVIYGAEGVDFLRQTGGRGAYAQNGKSYFVTVWPLLPDTLHPETGKTPTIRVAEAGGQIANWPIVTYSAAP